MKFYKETKFKKTEMGKIPEDWEVVKLDNKEYFEILPSGIKKFGGQKDYLSTESIQEDKIIKVETKIEFDNRPSRANMQPILNSVWFAKMKETLKVYAFIEKNIEEIKKYILSTGFCGIKCEEKVFPKYLRQFFLSNLFRLQKNRLATGSTQQDIKNGLLVTIDIFLPQNMDEQHAITEILSKVDEIIEKTDKIILKTQELKKGLMQQLLAKGIGHKKFKNSQIGRIPKEWDVTKFNEDFVDLKNGINFKREQKGDMGTLTIDVLNMYGEGIELNFEDLYRVNISLDENSNYLLKKGNILFVRSSLKREGAAWATLFSGYKEPVTFCGFIIRARLKSSKILPEFLTYFLRTNLARNKLISSSGQVTISNISQDNLRLLYVPIPSFKEQKEVVSILLDVDEKIAKEKQRKEQLKKLKRGLMQVLLTGKVRVRMG